MSATPETRRVPPNRQGSNPFHRKPLPLSPPLHSEGRKRLGNDILEHVVSYNSILQDDDNDGPSSTTNNKTTTPQPEQQQQLHRHLTLLDLLAVGVGGTIGSGLFVLAGLVSHTYAGPAAVVSWGVSGLAALLSGCCYAELAARIPLAGSAYAYSFVALGEWPAFLAATCLSLEYIAASAAVARSWGDKCALWLLQNGGEKEWLLVVVNANGVYWSPLAFVISSASVLLLLVGVKESKRITNVFTALKVSLVLFMIVAGSFFVQPTNWTPFAPQGVSGVLRGATGTFFGYLGYDQVCGLAGETISPKRNLPMAVLLTLGSVTVIYMTATLVLTGMQPAADISSVSGFPAAFHAKGANIDGQITALGELVTLPIVILVTVMIQPRLQYAMAEDGLLPAFFKQIDAHGNLRNGTLASGSLFILISSTIPFEHLNNIITCGVLTALSLSDSSLILLWHEAPDPESNRGHFLILAFHGAALVSSVLWTQSTDSSVGRFATFCATVTMMALAFAIHQYCPKTKAFGGRRKHYHGDRLLRDINGGYFRTPFVPFLPCAAIFINWYLIAQLDWMGVGGLLAFLAVSSLYYFGYASRFSLGSTTVQATPTNLSGTVNECTRLNKTSKNVTPYFGNHICK